VPRDFIVRARVSSDAERHKSNPEIEELREEIRQLRHALESGRFRSRPDSGQILRDILFGQRSSGRGLRLSVFERSKEAAEPNIFRQDGVYWTLGFQGKTIRIRPYKGLAALAHLLQHPGQELSPLLLSNLLDGASPEALYGALGSPAGDPRAGETLLLSDGTRYEEPDGQSGLAWQQGLDELSARVDAAETTEERAAARAALEKLTREFERHYGLVRVDGRLQRVERDPASQADRARKRIDGIIRYAIGKIREHHPELADHLDDAITVGTRGCSYRPAHPIDWAL
jgi:hypothetical protein